MIIFNARPTDAIGDLGVPRARRYDATAARNFFAFRFGRENTEPEKRGDKLSNLHIQISLSAKRRYRFDLGRQQ